MRKLVFVLTILGGSALADPLAAINPSDFHWKPKDALPPGASGAVLRGDPAKGEYDFVGKFPAKYTVPLHSHTNECVVVMRKGAMTIGRTGEKDVTIGEGGLFVLPAKLAYTAHCEAACEFLVHGTAAFDVMYADPKDDPRRK
jgi:uncharacterized protein YaiE (UPF0345 family)